MIMSREVLRRVGPHIKSCVKRLYSWHEDVELSRCIRRFAGVNCAWTYEVGSMIHESRYHIKSRDVNTVKSGVIFSSQILKGFYNWTSRCSLFIFNACLSTLYQSFIKNFLQFSLGHPLRQLVILPWSQAGILPVSLLLFGVPILLWMTYFGDMAGF